MSEVYVVEGPVRIGNVFGFYGDDVPPGRYAVVTDGEYANGGHGPSTALSRLFHSLEAAERMCVALSDCAPEVTPADVLKMADDLPADWREYTTYRPRVVRPLTPAAEARPPA